MSRTIDLTFLTPAQGFTIQGDLAYDRTGQSVSDAGDINGDGFADLIIGAYRNDAGGSDAGAAFVIFGQAGETRTNIDLTALPAADGFRIQGDLPGDLAGRSVSSAGDLNGDGIHDLIVGAPLNDAGGSFAGAAYVIFGQAGATRLNIDLTTLSAADGFRIQGVAYDRAGDSVSTAGDLNGDGFDDLIVGAYGNAAGGSYAGAAYVIFGQAGTTRADIDLTTLSAADGFRIQGDLAYDRAGDSVSAAGDLNGDGFDDLIVGAPDNYAGGDAAHAAYVIFGQAGATRGDIDLTTLSAADGFSILGDLANDRAGYSVSSAGDLNGDGFVDLIVGARDNDAGGDYAGAAYVIFGQAGATRADIDLTTLSAADGFRIQGDLVYDRAGDSVSAAGDLNGDGLDDLIVGAYGNDSGGSYAGAAYVIFGQAGATRADIDLTTLSAADGFRIQGDLAYDRAGDSVSAAGDLNGDGFDDLIVGSRDNDAGGDDAGAAYVIFGSANFGANAPPIAVDDELEATTNEARTYAAFRLLGNDVSPFTTSISDVSNATGGTVVLNGNGTVTFTPDLDFVGTAGFDYTVSDGAYSDVGHATVEVYIPPPPAATIDLTTLSAADGFRIQGDLAGDGAGRSVASAGDLNGDGFDDLIVGAYLNDVGGSNAGAAYVIFGQAGATRADIDLTTLSAADGFRIQGDLAGDFAGRSVAAAGDLNGDGFDDLIVGAHGNDAGGSNAGAAYVIFGQAGATRADIDLTTLSAADGFRIQGDLPGDLAGRSVSSAGDLNGDGFGDLIVGAPFNDAGGSSAGAVYVIFGQAGATRADVDLTTLSAADGFRIQGYRAGDQAGISVASAGDLNGDGIDDLIVGAPFNDAGGSSAGAAYVIFGQAGATRTDIDLTTLSAADGFRIQGDTPDDLAGFSVAATGDLNGDGFADLIVGACNNDAGGYGVGAVYVIFGQAGATRADIDLTTLSAADGFRIQGDLTRRGHAGFSVASSGDVNGDGFTDLIIGAPANDGESHDIGAAYVIFGQAGATRTDIDLTTLSAADGFRIQGGPESDYVGFSVSSTGDLNDDGFADLIVGTIANLAYVIYGSASIGVVNSAPTDLTISSANVDENAVNGTVIGTLTTTDPDAGDTTTYSLLDNAGGRFAIDASSGELSVLDGSLLNREAVASYNITVRVTDSRNLTYDEIFAISVSDVDEFDVTAPVDTDGASGGSITENAAALAAVGITAVSTDDDATTNTITYSLVAGDGRFDIDTNTGVVTVAVGAAFDTETEPSIVITVRATSADTSFADANFTIDVTDVDEFDVTAPIDTNGASGGTIDDHALLGTAVGITALSSDADATNSAVAYSLFDSAGGRFAINTNSGVVTLAGAVDAQVKASHSITVRATSADGSTADSAFNIAVTGAPVTVALSLTGAADAYTAPTSDHYIIDGLGGNDIITAQGGNDVIRGNAGDDAVNTGDGNDILTYLGAGDGFDTVNGGLGTDEIRALGANAVIGLKSVTGVELITANGFGGVQIKGSSSADNLNFSSVTLSGISKIDAGLGNDTVVGGGIADTIIGGAGNDNLNGDGGNDVFEVGTAAGSDTFDGGSGYDLIRAMANNVSIGIESLTGIDEISSNGKTNIKLVGSGNANTLDFSSVLLSGTFVLIDGGSGNDIITGTADADTIYGNVGTDTIDAGGGDDFIQFGAGTTDSINGGAGTNDVAKAIANNASLLWTNVSNVEAVDGTGFTGVKLLGTSGSNTLNFSAVTLTNVALIDGGNGNDIITGSAGADTIYGNGGTDTINAGGGNDVIQFGLNTADTIDGGANSDTVKALVNNSTLVWTNVSNIETVDTGTATGVALLGTAAGQTLDFSGVAFLGANPVRLDAGGGNDTLVGSAVADLLVGGAGGDSITGGGGADTFDYNAVSESTQGGSNFDSIQDFVSGLDKIDLSTIDANSTLAGNQAFVYIGNAAFSNTAGELRFDMGTPGVTRILGDTNGDGIVDLEIQLVGQPAVVSGDFSL